MTSRPGYQLRDEEARRHAVNDLDTSFCVEAGAGTGKTTILVERIKNLIIRGYARVGEIVAITFTEAAAAELKARLRQELEKALAELTPGPLPGDAPAQPPATAQRLAAAVSDLDQAAISTIHSFAASLLRERPVEAGLDPDFGVLDPVADGLLFDELWEEWLAGQLADPAAAEGAGALRRALALGLPLDNLKQLAQTLAANQDLRLGSFIDPPDAGAFLAAFREGVRELEELKGDCVNPEDAGYRHTLELAGARRLLDGMGRERQEAFLAQELQIKVKGNKAAWKPSSSCDRQKAICRDLAERLTRLQQALRSAAVVGLIGWLDGFVARLRSERRRRGRLNFQDLLLEARDLLRDHREVRRYFQQRFRYLLVDEFQDTDPLQVEIVFFLAEAEPRAAAWLDVAVVPGKLFIVGDPKQSIYRFRRADIETYQAAKAHLAPPRGAHLFITVNFRTVPGIIQWVNDLFGTLIKLPEHGSYQPAYVALDERRPALGRPDRGEPPGDGASQGASQEDGASQGGPPFPPVIFLVPPPDFAPIDAERTRQAEARAIAALIRRAVGEGWVTFEKREQRERPLRYGDVAILFPTTTGMDHYTAALREHGIPARLEAGKSFYRRDEVASLGSLLRAIDNPNDAVSIVAALRSLCFGCSDRALFRWASRGGGFNYLEAAEGDTYSSGGVADQAARELAQVRDALSLLRQLHGLRNERSISAVIEEAFRRTKVLLSHYLQPHGGQAVANLLRALEQARALERGRGADPGLTFRRFVRWLSELQEQQVAEEEAPAAEEGADAVRLLTVHKAKGLEFPFVVLANLNSARSKREDFVFDRQRGTYELKLGAKETGFLTPGYEEAAKGEEARMAAEERRLFYVAATRARDYLALPFFHRGQPKGFLSLVGERWPEVLGGFLPGDAPAVCRRAEDGPAALGTVPTVVGGGPEPEAVEVDAAWQLREAWANDLRSAIERASRGVQVLTPSGLKHAEDSGMAGGTFPSPPAAAEAPVTEVPPAAEEARRRAAAFGSAFHAAMESLDLAAAAAGDRQALRAAATPAARAEGVEERLEELLEALAKCLQTPLMQRATRARRVHREMPFALAVEGAPAPGAILEGRIDLVCEEPDGLLVVDYKTENVQGTRLEEHFANYRPQGEAYARALRAITGQPVKEVAFLFVRTQQVRSLFPSGTGS